MCFSAYWWIDLVSVLPDYVALVLATAAGCRLDRWLRTLRRGASVSPLGAFRQVRARPLRDGGRRQRRRRRDRDSARVPPRLPRRAPPIDPLRPPPIPSDPLRSPQFPSASLKQTSDSSDPLRSPPIPSASPASRRRAPSSARAASRPLTRRLPAAVRCGSSR